MIGWVIEEIRDLRFIPSVGFMVFVEFDFEVDLHELLITVLNKLTKIIISVFRGINYYFAGCLGVRVHKEGRGK